MSGASFAVVGGRVVPVDQPAIDNGTVLVRDGVIVAVGRSAEVPVPHGMRVVDARQNWVLPGLVEAHSHLGISEEGEYGDELNEPADSDGAFLRVLDGVNPADSGFADALSGGVTTAAILPGSANPIGGQVAALKCAGTTVDDMVVSALVALKSALGENPLGRSSSISTRFGLAAAVRAAFTEARGSGGDDESLRVRRMVLDGEIPLFQHAHRADDIATAMRLADEFGYRLVVHHGTEAHLLADALAERGIPVVAGPLLGGRSKVELRNRTVRGPGILARAGVVLALTTDHSGLPVEHLALQAAVAVREGLDRDAALRAITTVPAQLLGLGDRIGAIRAGLDADLVLWSGDPFDVMSRVESTFVDGALVYARALHP